MTSTAIRNNKVTTKPTAARPESDSRPAVEPTSRSLLVTDKGSTHISDNVVAKISALAAREIPGVHSMGTGFARRMGQLKSLVQGAQDKAAPTQGVAVEVGEREAAVDLDLVTWYGQSIVEISEAVRTNVMDRVERMTGLRVVEVNINVDDVFVESDDDNSGRESRVQ